MTYDALAVTTMASGHLCLCVSEHVAWEEFPTYAAEFLKTVGGTKAGTVDSVDIRMWNVVLDNASLSLVFDDHPLMVSLESASTSGDDVIRRLYDRLSSGEP
jgi:hypothetical protein